MGGAVPEPEPVVIVDYDPGWPGLFAPEAARVVEATRPYVFAVEHIGSTAVPGLAAKATIDIMLGLCRLGDAPVCIERLVALGYTYYPEFEKEIPERRCFSRRAADAIKYNLHVVEVGSPFWERHLLFRDWLRAHAEDAAAYANLKRHLAGEFKDDRTAYTDSKTEFIRAVEEKARAEWAKGGPPPS